MNSFLFGGIAITDDKVSLQDWALVMVQQQGGSLNPVINLFDNQALYAKLYTLSGSDSEIAELVRICPHVSNPQGRSTIEYMVCYER